MTREQIEKNAREYRKARIEKAEGQIDPRVDILIDKFEKAYIAGAESRDSEIAELVELLKIVNYRMRVSSDIVAREWCEKAGKLLKKYEQ